MMGDCLLKKTNDNDYEAEDGVKVGSLVETKIADILLEGSA